ncbi:hypothetical protein BN1013_00337 [Candidatus Rubidus massiliensis]|nr:hypothetical protein BN1013_00337 [Candidatus Rubidus massiliensis]
MFDIPIDNVKVVHEYVVNETKSSDLANDDLYLMTEVDLSFCDALAGMCSGESSSGPVNRPTPKHVKKSTA